MGQKPKIGDIILTALMFTSSLLFFFITYKYAVQKQLFGIVFFLFGVLSFRMCYIDYKGYTNKVTDTLYGLKNHIGRMTGSYIAAFTAFLVVNNTFLPPILAWSLPGLIGGLFISRTIRKFNKE